MCWNPIFAMYICIGTDIAVELSGGIQIPYIDI